MTTPSITHSARLADWSLFVPKLVTVFQEGYSRASFKADIFAGLTVAIVAMPLSMALAIASGVGPERGLFTAIVAGALISALGGSRHQIGGPTGAFVVVVFNVVARFGYDGLVVATLMAGAMLVAAGIARLGTFIKYIPYPVVTGFTTGIALIIFSSQIGDLLGLTLAHVPGDVVGKWQAYLAAIGTFRWQALVIAACTLGGILAVQRLAPRLPAFLLIIALASAIALILHFPIQTIGTRFGAIPNMLPAPHLPSFTFAELRLLFPSAFTIFLLGGIESLLSAVVADGMTGRRHRSNGELVAQGIANMASACMGGVPATGAIARTATNIRAGAQSPVAGVIHALTLLCVLLFASRLVAYVPMAVLAGILMVVSYNMGEWREIPQLLKLTKTDISVWLVTFALTVFADLTVAVEAGMILAALLFISRVAATTTVSQVTDDYIEDGRVHILQDKDIPYYATIFRIHGPFLFGATDKISVVTENMHALPPVVILRLRNMTALDATGLFAIEEVARALHDTGRTLILCGAREQPAKLLHQAEFEEVIGKNNICDNVQDAVERAQDVFERMEAKVALSGK